MNEKCISIVGARAVTPDGILRTERLVRELAWHGFTIVSGLARGTDTVALQTALQCGLNVIGVIGTPIDEYYPLVNRELQEKIAHEHLLISQVPFYKYATQPFDTKRIYFVERNATMTAISMATVIIEAFDTSGILAQACIDQNANCLSSIRVSKTLL
jgi:DNA processing protein